MPADNVPRMRLCPHVTFELLVLPNNPDITPAPRRRTRHRSQATHPRSHSIPSRAYSQTGSPPQPRGCWVPSSGTVAPTLFLSQTNSCLQWNTKAQSVEPTPTEHVLKPTRPRVKCSEGQQSKTFKGHTQPCLACIPKTLMCEEVGLVRPSLCIESSGLW